MKRLLLGSVISAVIKVVSAGLTFLMFTVLARVLSSVEYGQFATMFSLGTAGAVTALLGQHSLSMKILSGLEDTSALAVVRRRVVLRSYAIVTAGTAACCLLLVLGWAADHAMGLGIGGPTLLGACLMIMPFALAELASHHYRAYDAISWALIPRDVLWRAGVVMLCLTAAVLPWAFSNAFRTMLTISSLLMIIALIQIAVFFAVFLSRLSTAGSGLPSPVPGPRFSLWMWLAALVAMGGNLNVVVASTLAASDQIGAYFAAQKTAQLLQLPILAVNIVAGPTFARLYAKGDWQALQHIGQRLALILIVPLTAGALLLMLLAPQILALFDPTFVTAVPALIILAASHLFVGLGGSVHQLMLMANGERTLVLLTAAAELIGLALVIVLMPALGILGAALGALAAKVIITILAVRWCRRMLNVDTSILSLVPRH